MIIFHFAEKLRSLSAFNEIKFDFDNFNNRRKKVPGKKFISKRNRSVFLRK